MVIVKIMGGIGNQLFQYALAYELLSKGAEVKVDTSFFDFFPEGNTPRDCIGSFLDIPFDEANENEIELLKNEKLTFVDKLLRRKNLYLDEDCFDSKIIKVKRGYLLGYWQSEKFFNDVNVEIRKIILSKYEYGGELDGLKSPVSIHFRGGDYYNKYNVDTFGNICDTKYYENAISKIKSVIPDCSFVVFTNDIDLAKEVLPKEKFIFINHEANQGYEDMCLMSKCKANILANSSFSWWGAWLNNSTEKVVIAPSQWNKKKNTPDIYCKDWILI